MTCATSIHRWRLPLICVLSAALLGPAACGGGEKKVEAPSQRQDEMHERIKQLMTQIEDMEQGREVTPLPALETLDGDGADFEAASSQADVQTMSAKPTKPTRRTAPMPVSPPPPANMCFARNPDERGERCTEVCQLAGNICANAGSICRLAAQLDGDTWANGRCTEATQSCTRADQRCCECQ